MAPFERWVLEHVKSHASPNTCLFPLIIRDSDYDSHYNQASTGAIFGKFCAICLFLTELRVACYILPRFVVSLEECESSSRELIYAASNLRNH